jgi:hypothetical protein
VIAHRAWPIARHGASRMAAIVVAAIALGGCASAEDYEPPLVRVSAAATDIAAGRDCTRGNQACIDAVVAEMQRRYDHLAPGCDHRAPFALMYMRVTEGVKQPDSGRFRDQDYLRRLDALFARLYFRAYDDYEAGRLDKVPPAWRIAFDSARRGLTTGIGDMLLGMNAHISNDLPFALLDGGLEAKGGKSAQADYDAVNNLLGDVQAPMIQEQAKLFDPAIADATLPYLGVYGGQVATVIAGWRTEAWQNGVDLVNARSPVARVRVAARIRAAAAQRARLIQAAASNRLLGGDRSERDEYCRSRGAGA